MDSKRYIVSTLIIEAFITFAIIVCNGDPEDKDTRDIFRKKMYNLHTSVSLVGSLQKNFNDIRSLRNSFVHPVKVNGAVDVDKSVDILKEKIKGIISIYKKIITVLPKRLCKTEKT